MPEAFDRQRFDRIRHQAMLTANLWLAVAIAAERGDKADAVNACQNVQKLTKEIYALVKELGTEGDNAKA